MVLRKFRTRQLPVLAKKVLAQHLVVGCAANHKIKKVLVLSFRSHIFTPQGSKLSLKDEWHERSNELLEEGTFMAAKPVIGINMDFRSSCKEHASLSFIAAGYYENIIQSGGIPLVLPPLEDEDDLVRVLDTLDGVVLIGGADLDPQRDGYMPHPAVRNMDHRREDMTPERQDKNFFDFVVG
ncbi:MAG: C26 family cysteine hydrolase domain-containing family, partial [Planctomycetaceae bacterium]|nr:C26 family cysteine hydrolase domain-containing family [Planctomycetaceae bacterium]